MITVLQAAALIWDLGAETPYDAGDELTCNLTFTAPSAGTYYLLGALYTAGAVYINGTMFGLLLPEGSTYAVNDYQYSSIWELEEDEEVELPCRITLDRTNVILGLFLMKMVGDSPSLDNDEEAGSVTTTLAGTVPVGIDLSQIIMLAAVVAVAGAMVAMAVKEG